MELFCKWSEKRFVFYKIIEPVDTQVVVMEFEICILFVLRLSALILCVLTYSESNIVHLYVIYMSTFWVKSQK